MRLKRLLVRGDLLQMIFVTPNVLFSGAAAMPALDRLDLSDLTGGIYYYQRDVGGFIAEGLMSQASYAASAAPEPAVAWLLPLGVLLIVAARRRSAQPEQARGEWSRPFSQTHRGATHQGSAIHS